MGKHKIWRFVYGKMDNIDFEKFDTKTLDYAKSETDKFVEKVRTETSNIISEMSEIYKKKRIVSVSITRGYTAYVCMENGVRKIFLNDLEIYSTENLISWIKIDDDTGKLAFVETTGSDYGKLSIIYNKKIEYEEEGWIEGIIFGEKLYIIKEKRSENIENGEKTGPRVYYNGEEVFGRELPIGMGISAYQYGDTVFILAGDETKSIIFKGHLDSPETWKIYGSYDKNVKILGYINETLYLLIYDSNGIITFDKKIISFPKPVYDAVIVDNGFLVTHLDDAKIKFTIYNFEGKIIEEIPCKLPYGLIDVDSNMSSALISVSSFGVSSSLLLYENGMLKTLEENKVLDVICEDKFVDYKGRKIHYFSLRTNKKNNYALVYGYGGFNIPMSPSYNPLFCYLLKHGVNVVVCNLPGGSEYGEEWHKWGMRENKINVYDSFQEIIREVKKENSKVICYGVSNGGLLSAYTLTKIPEILSASIIGNPVIDLMRYHKLLAGQYWISEYGNPDDPKDAKFLREYSPYETLVKNSYPPTLIYSRMNDDRVHPAHALKFYEKLKIFSRNVFLMVSSGGHMGSNAKEQILETSRIAAFAMMIFENKIS
jgi:prolyl oligopeptidase